MSAVEVDRVNRDLSRAPVRRAVTEVRDARIAILGYGRVGQAVAATLRRRRDVLAGHGLRVSVTVALARHEGKPRGEHPPPLCFDPNVFFDGRAGDAGSPDLVVEVMGGLRPAGDLVRRALGRGIPVVTANKTLMATDGGGLRRLARARRTTIAFEAAVVAGVPFLGALLRRPIVASPRRLAGLLNGTSHFLACQLERGATWESALAEAVARGYAEPDSAADTSGRDAALKLSILLQAIGCSTAPAARLPTLGLDALSSDDFRGARALGGTLKPAAVAVLTGAGAGAWVGPAFIDRRHRFFGLSGVDNAVELEDDDGRTVAFAGPGAGPDATAATIVDDIVEILTTRNARHAPPHPERTLVAGALGRPPAGGWYFRITATEALPAACVAERLAAHRLTTLVVAHAGGHAYARSTPAPWAAALEAAVGFTGTGASVLVLPVIEGV